MPRAASSATSQSPSTETDDDVDRNTTNDTTNDLEAICERLRRNDPTLTIVSLPYSALCRVQSKAHAMGDNGMTILTTALLQSSHVHTLELIDARPDYSQAACLAQTIKYHQHLHTLKLIHCQSNGLTPILIFQALQRQTPKQRQQRPRNRSHPITGPPRRNSQQQSLEQQQQQQQQRASLPKAAYVPNSQEDAHAHGSTHNHTHHYETTPQLLEIPILTSTRGLRVLELSGDALDITAAGALQSLLATNRDLTTLRLADMDMDESFQRAILRGLQQNQSPPYVSSSTGLQVLSLVNCGITDFFCLGLGAALSFSPTATNTTTNKRYSGLAELDLTRNRITDEGAVALAQVLAHNNDNDKNDDNSNSLVKLSLSWNRLTMETGVPAFMDRLPQYTRLQALHLYHPDMYVPLSVYQQVVACLEQGPPPHNNDNDGQGSSKSKSNYNCTLQSLSIGCESISSDSASSLSSSSSSSACHYMQERNAVLDELRFLWQDPAYSEAAKRLAFLLHLNKSGRRYLEVMPGNGTGAASPANVSARHRDQVPDGPGATTLPGHAVWPEILHKFGTHCEQEQRASGIFHLLRTRPGNLFC
jgi:Ran GTPase-activating protein (RanGAP) involved in mRNA processing and transport